MAGQESPCRLQSGRCPSAAWIVVVAAFTPTAYGAALPASRADEQEIVLPQLHQRAHVVRDAQGIAHVSAADEHDLLLLQGYVHALDRLFQMDVNRRLASGTLAELVGSGALPSDVQLRTIGLRRASERTLQVLSPEVMADLTAYAEGVNEFVATHPLPLEYSALELTRFEPWTPLDSLVVGRLIGFSLSFEIDVDPTVQYLTYLQAGAFLGFDGDALFFEDVHRCAGFDPAATIPDASGGPQPPGGGGDAGGPAMQGRHAPRAKGRPIAGPALELAKHWRAQLDAVPAFAGLLDPSRRAGSNEWAVAGSLTTSGRPWVANDPHLGLTTPSTWYPIHLLGGGFAVTGQSLAGVPYVLLGHNERVAWGATNNLVDVTDTYVETILVDPSSPSGLSSVYLGNPEPILPLPELFRANQPGNGVPDDIVDVPPGGDIPAFTLIVPRRNQGPIVALDLDNLTAISIQCTGFSPTRELEALRGFDLARDIAGFRDALNWYDFGSQSWAVADLAGDIAYFTCGEIPLREDLAAGTVNGLPPFFIRDGAGGNEWIPDPTPRKRQAIPYKKIFADHLPAIVDPPLGWFVNANNDPTGFSRDNDPLNQSSPQGGIFYLAYTFADGVRAGRITELLQAKLALGPVSLTDLEEIQADTVERDALVFVPWIVAALARAQGGGVDPQLEALGADPGVTEAVGRLGSWDLTSPTGIDEGYDAADVDGQLAPPSPEEVAASVAATLYHLWRGRFVANTVEATLTSFGLPTDFAAFELTGLKKLLEDFSTRQGVGASGIDFFTVPGVADPADERDILLLASLRQVLDLLASPAFDAAFHGSTLQDDYRWGRLHRLVLEHPLGGPFNTPPAGGTFPPPLPGLDGIPIDGAATSVDVAPCDIFGADSDAFLVQQGPSQRFACELGIDRPRGRSSLPGGPSGDLFDPFHLSLLLPWLTNESYLLLLTRDEVKASAFQTLDFTPN